MCLWKPYILLEYENKRHKQTKESHHYKEINEINNMHLMDGIQQSTFNRFPILNAYTGPCDWTDSDFIPFSRRKLAKKKGGVVHCFEHDTFFNAFWTNMDKSIYELKDFDAVFTPDFTMFVDVPETHNKWQLLKSRLCGARMQQVGYNVIPTITYGDATSLTWCLEGLAPNGVYGISGTGIQGCSAKLKLFQYAMRKIEEELAPVKVFVYGEPVTIPGFTTEIYLYQLTSQSILEDEHEISPTMSSS